MQAEGTENFQTNQHHWSLCATNGKAAGEIRVKATAWKLLNADTSVNVKLDLTAILKRLSSPALWPAQEAFLTHCHTVATQLAAQPQAVVFLRRLYPWFPLVLTGAYRADPESLARVALFLLYLSEHIDKDESLLPTQALLTQQAYAAVATLYEDASPEPARSAHLEQIFRELFRRLQPLIADPDRRWLFAYPLPTLTDTQTLTVELMPTIGDEDRIAMRREAAMINLLTPSPTQTTPSPYFLPLSHPPLLRLRRFFREHPQGSEAVRTLIEHWFLPRYDLPHAEQLKAALNERPIGEGHRWFLRWRRWYRLALWVAIFAYGSGGMLLPLISCSAFSRSPLWSYLTGAIYLFGVLTLPQWFLVRRPDTSLPRLFAGILLAAIGTILQQRWDALLTFAYGEQRHPLAPWLIFALSLLIFGTALKLLLYKVRRATGYTASTPLLWKMNEDPGVCRTYAVAGRGLPVAFLLSLLVVDMVGTTYLADLPDTVPMLPGYFHSTSPLLVLFLTALLFFVGIFSQFFWEDRALTEPVA